MTRILALDASTEACSVALYNRGEVTEFYKLAPREHAKLLLPRVEMLLADSGLTLTQLDAIACNLGPGAFTGIRIAVAVAQGLAFGAQLPTIGISSLENMAYTGFSQASVSSNTGQNSNKHWICAIDARMNEIYMAAYSVSTEGKANCIFEPCVISPEAVDWSKIGNQESRARFNLIGSGWQAYQDQLFSDESGLTPSFLFADGYPRAKHSLQLAVKRFNANEVSQPNELQPVYLRNNVAKKKATA
ncbi:tRNA (adenosine(37)-N6)-threonylcarbamoyltransferase complex dimerization subunit type 1 TsaB [Aliikangiella sp. G2MR2-5]|uniref:tRNA (adenosine(37)-N6)-threonylcarbamoyltransferase complex dimerization subunit type 1 TsaB n=1 Tax=Aliikangiella sp. G2MR2-5 TaxID=2788943 RepID=UPI0018A90D3B|nr:tRNA (adenosine(37)-N6)-threonylcarbamoyltransferase complex dimerization subunit type 1 TsaB [Aliikangiella sp. G2MR2-5]